jgi:hypothetical protein
MGGLELDPSDSLKKPVADPRNESNGISISIKGGEFLD